MNLRDYGHKISSKYGMPHAHFKNMAYSDNYITTVTNDSRGERAIKEIKETLGASRVSLRGRGPMSGRPKKVNFVGIDVTRQDLPLSYADRIAVYRRSR